MNTLYKKITISVKKMVANFFSNISLPTNKTTKEFGRLKTDHIEKYIHILDNSPFYNPAMYSPFSFL